MTTWRDVPGWFNGMDLYDEVALTTPPYTTVVEVGVAFGKSLLYLAQRIKETGKDIRVMAVDPWLPYPEHHFLTVPPQADTPDSERFAYEYAARHGGIFPAFLHALYDSGLAGIVDVVRAPSVAASRMAGAPGAPGARPVHFVFIDAYHVYEHVKADIDAWWATGPEWMAGDDFNPGSEVDFPGVWKAVHEKFGRENVGQRQTTSWVVRRSHMERPVKPIAGSGAQVLETVRAWRDKERA
jgi:hypothetical protein